MLKKLVVLLAVVAFATNALAAATVKTGPVLSSEAGWATANIKFTPSKSVVLGYQSGVPASDASSTSPSIYSIGSKNSAGDSLFAATSASTSIVFSKSTAGYTLNISDLPLLPTDATDSTITGGASNWSVL